MKKILYSLIAVVASGFVACSDQNDVVNDLIKEVENKVVVKQIDYTLVKADYTAMANYALAGEGLTDAEKTQINAVKTTGALNSAVLKDGVVSQLLKSKYPALGLNSAVKLHYAYTQDYLSRITATPPSGLLSENFETGYAANDLWNKNGWKQFATKGTKTWQIRSYSSNFYGQVSAYGGAVEETEIYVVSPAVALTKPTGNYFSFSVCVGSWNYAGLSVLVTADANALTAPASVTWDDVTSNFTIPTTPTSGYGVMGPAGQMSLDAYTGKTIYIAFRYNGATNTTPARTTTYQVDNVLVADAPVVSPLPGQVFINDPEDGWVLYANGIAVTKDDMDAMGVTSLTAQTAPGYIPAFLAQKFTFAQEGDRKAVVYGSLADEYVYTGGRWEPTTVGALDSGQYVNDGTKWIFDPTISFVMSKDDYQIAVTEVLSDPELEVYFGTNSDGSPRTNEEWYYGFNAYYGNISFRLSYRASGSSKDNDTELHALDGDTEAQIALLWERLEQEGMPLFLSLKYPDSPTTSNGVQLYYNVTALIYYPDGLNNLGNNGVYYTFRYKVLTAGSAGVPPTFEHVSTEES